MPICRKCGIEFDEKSTSCPLCKTVPGEDNGQIETENILTSKIVSKKKIKTKSWLWEMITFVSFAGLIVIFAVDFAYGMNITWSRFPLISLIFVWLTFTLLLRLKKRICLIILLETIILLVLLWFLDLFVSTNPWFFKLALPIVLSLSFLTFSSHLIIKKSKLSVFSVLAIYMTSCGIFLLFLDLVLHNFMECKSIISWSVVAFACIIPLVVFLLYFQKRLKKKGIDLQRYFHI
ncbi:MAG: hypothetical protein H8E57_03525 [Candidatus Cloacimonetes bacterium]|nr:hypothetical protein [Candidatus Cloacimonadota bacterium]